MGGRESARVWGTRGFVHEHVLSVTSSTCLKAPSGFPLRTGWRLTASRGPRGPACPSYLPASAHTGPSTCHTLLASLSGAPSPDWARLPDPDRVPRACAGPSQIRQLGLHRSWCGIIRSLKGSPSRKGASSGRPGLSGAWHTLVPSWSAVRVHDSTCVTKLSGQQSSV